MIMCTVAAAQPGTRATSPMCEGLPQAETFSLARTCANSSDANTAEISEWSDTLTMRGRTRKTILSVFVLFAHCQPLVP